MVKLNNGIVAWQAGTTAVYFENIICGLKNPGQYFRLLHRPFAGYH
jgi:hypothetical protein